MGHLKGLAHDGEALWAAETEKGRIHRIDPSNGESTDTHPTPAEGHTRPSGLAWDGEMLWNNDTRTVYCGSPEQDATYRFYPGKAPQKEFEGIRDCPFGLAFGGGHLWVGENSTHRIYMIDTADGSVLDSIEAPGRFINGLAYAEGGLWVTTNGKEKELHRIEIELEEQEGYVEVHQKGDFFYPNPADQRIRIELPEDAPEGAKQLGLYGPNGRRILMRSIEGRRDRIDLPELSNGIHYLRILNDGTISRSSPVLIAQ
jgi:sugar lactone lactonase YvrE